MGVRSVKLDPALGFTAPQDLSLWPSLLAWYRGQESGGNIVSNLSPRRSEGFDELLPFGDAAGVWGPAGGMSGAVSPNRYWRGNTLLSGAALTAVGAKSVLAIFEVQGVVVSAALTTVFSLGLGSIATSGAGFQIGIGTSAVSGRLYARAAGITAATTTSTLPGTDWVDGRNQYMLFWDRTSTSLGTLKAWMNGTYRGTANFNTDPGAINLQAASNRSRFGVGANLDNGQHLIGGDAFNCQFYAMTTPPVASMDDIAADAFMNPSRLPRLLSGVT